MAIRGLLDAHFLRESAYMCTWTFMWVVVKIMVPFWIPIIGHLIFRVSKK